MSHPDAIVIFVDLTSVNNLVNRFFPDLTTTCTPRWCHPLKIAKVLLKLLFSWGSNHRVFLPKELLCLHIHFLQRDWNYPFYISFSNFKWSGLNVKVGAKLSTKRQNFRPAHIQSICRRHNKCHRKNGNLFRGREENIVGKGENAGYQHFSILAHLSTVSYCDCAMSVVHRQHFDLCTV